MSATTFHTWPRSLVEHQENVKEIALQAAEQRREAAEIMWSVNNMERRIDPNSRVKYVHR